MKKLVSLILPLLLLVASSCQKLKVEISEHPFTIELKQVQPRALMLDIIPESNDFYYYVDIIDVESFNTNCHGSDVEYIRSMEEVNRIVYEFEVEEGYETQPYEISMLYKDAILEPFWGNEFIIEPDTDYYVCAFAYDSDIHPIEILTKVKFHTPKEIHSDITFEVSLFGSEVTVTPSNGDQYLFDYVDEFEFDESYGGSPILFYSDMVNLYVQYGFIEQMVSRGEDTDDMALYYDLTEGDVMYLAVAGYENGRTSELEAFKLTYNGPDVPGAVERIQ